jgi:hypothetical protein
LGPQAEMNGFIGENIPIILVFSENNSEKYIPKKSEKNIFLQFSFVFDFSLVMNKKFILPLIGNKCR